MEREEVLEKAGKKKAFVSEFEKAKINKSCWISLIVTGIVAIIFMIVEGLLGHFAAIYAIGAICFTWAAVFYFCQYFIAKRPYGVLIGAILESVGAITMLTVYILFNVGVL